MALEINRRSVLKDKTVLDFWQKVEKFTAKASKSNASISLSIIKTLFKV
jgi:hypothetical protein